MSYAENKAYETPLVDLLRAIPEDHRICIPFQWAEDGTETGHRFIPVGVLMHKAAARIAALEREVAVLRDARKADEALRYRMIADKDNAEISLAISAQQVESLAASVRQVEVERDAMREDAERWDCIVFHWQHGEVTLECDDQGYFVLQSDPAEFAQQVFRGDCPDAAIDAARKA